MIMNIRMLRDDCREQTFIDMPGREISFAEVRLLIAIIEVKFEGLCYLVVCSYEMMTE